MTSSYQVSSSGRLSERNCGCGSGRRLGGKDDEISVISSEQAKELYKNRFLNFAAKKQSAKEGWHSDITFEPVPSDYALLRLTELPKTGGGRFQTNVNCLV